jgi:D-inositol-3-phosphate glycosyltransferase
VARTVDHVVATCSDELFELVRLGADRRHITVVPCGVDLRTFTDRGPAWPRTPGLRRIVCLTRLVERKGVAEVVQALARVPGAELLVAGGPERRALETDPEARRLRALADEHGVLDRVRLLGRVGREEAPALLRSADVVCCTPWYEPFGIVPLEAMACGVPVVASAVGGLIDTVMHGVTGAHVPPRDPDAIAAALTEVLADDAHRRALGAAGARRARARYGWPRVAGATLRVYEELVAAPAELSTAEGSRT